MPHISQTRLHHVYMAERCGDTLVVTPRGDAAGFSVSSVATEMATITAIAQSGGTKHLIVDLGQGNYFGSIVLGSIVKLGNVVKGSGGRIALCGASRDMQDILRLMKLEQMWEMFSDRRAALRNIATIPLGERLWAQRRAFAWLVLIAVTVGLYFVIPRPKYGRQYYAELSELFREVENARETAGVERWQRLEKKCQNRINAIVEALEKADKGRKLYDAEPYILIAARDHWMQSMQRSGDAYMSDGHFRMVQHYLRCAEAKLEGRPVPGFPKDIWKLSEEEQRMDSAMDDDEHAESEPPPLDDPESEK